MTKDRAEALFEAFVAHDEMELTRGYLAEGRRYAGLTDALLNSSWLGAWRDFHLDLQEAGRDRYNDLSAELRLRGLALPEHLISPEARQQVTARVSEIADHPDVQARLADAIKDFFKDWQKPRN